jgi:hypothetical protein
MKARDVARWLVVFLLAVIAWAALEAFLMASGTPAQDPGDQTPEQAFATALVLVMSLVIWITPVAFVVSLVASRWNPEIRG